MGEVGRGAEVMMCIPLITLSPFRKMIIDLTIVPVVVSLSK